MLYTKHAYVCIYYHGAVYRELYIGIIRELSVFLALFLYIFPYISPIGPVGFENLNRETVLRNSVPGRARGRFR